tara:strand:+ start:141 stop:875 length:735 start_codon:yes stop_codon:yes gene_type:complete
MEIFWEFIIILILSLFQSLFGIGLLLFGTPTFLFLGYDFESTLALLLPISVTISFLQIMYEKSSIRSLASEFNIFCLPYLVIFLLLVINLGNVIEIRTYVAAALIISSILILNKNRILEIDTFILKYRKLSLVFIGTVHGFTNMGGSFLSMFSTVVTADRASARKYIAFGYLVMGTLQYITLLIFGTRHIDLDNLYYVIVPLVVFFPTQNLFKKIDDSLFMNIITYIALIFGFLVLGNSLKTIF